MSQLAKQTALKITTGEDENNNKNYDISLIDDVHENIGVSPLNLDDGHIANCDNEDSEESEADSNEDNSMQKVLH